MKETPTGSEQQFAARRLYLQRNRTPGGSVRRAVHCLLALLLGLLAISDAQAAGDGDGVGRGWTLPRTDLTLGGYASSSVNKLSDAPWSLDLDHLSLFLWWQGQGRFRFFSETDLEQAVQIQTRRVSADNAYLAVERLYVDWTQSDALNLRIGKFLTPIGRWNLIHAAPLVWTTSRPLITQHTFPTNATGAMLYGTVTSIGAGLDYSVYGSVGKELRPNPAEDPFKEAYGVHLSYPLGPTVQMGFSFANFEQAQEVGERKNLLGVDAFWAQGGYEVSAEAAWRLSSEGSESDEKGAFVQGVAPLGGSFYAVARYEYFQPSGRGGTGLWLGGVDYRLSRRWIFKTEFSKAEHDLAEAPSGFRASVAVLF
jgi:hypothetical protein